MANISLLPYPYFADGSTNLNAQNLNPIIAKMNEVITELNGGSPTPTPTTVATPTISISGTTATISCSTSDATIYYTTNGNTPTTSSTQYSSPISLSGACTIKAIAVKSGMTNSTVASQSYTPSVSPEAQAALAKFSNLSSAQQTKVENLVDTLVSAGIYSKVHYLSLPIVASTVSEALQNILSDVTPPSVDGATVNQGLTLPTGLVDLTSLVSQGQDYEDYVWAASVEFSTSQSGSTARIAMLSSTPPSSPATTSNMYHNVSDSKLKYKGFGSERSLAATDNVVTYIIAHDKVNAQEKFFYQGTTLTTQADTATPTNNGLAISSNGTSTYNVAFTGKYRLLILGECLSDTQMEALKSAIETFLA